MLEGEDTLKWWINNKPPLLHSILTELHEKTNSMRKLIEQDAESFSQRAEIYYNKRPQLINKVHDFHRMHSSLAQSYDQLIKFESGSHLLTSLSLTKNRLRKSLSLQENALHSYSEGCKFVEFHESEVDDPDTDPEEQVVVEDDSGKEERRRLREDLEKKIRFKGRNRI